MSGHVEDFEQARSYENLAFGGGPDDKSVLVLGIVLAEPSLPWEIVDQYIQTIRGLEVDGIAWGEMSAKDHMFGLRKIVVACEVERTVSTDDIEARIRGALGDEAVADISPA